MMYVKTMQWWTETNKNDYQKMNEKKSSFFTMNWDEKMSCLNNLHVTESTYKMAESIKMAINTLHKSFHVLIVNWLLFKFSQRIVGLFHKQKMQYGSIHFLFISCFQRIIKYSTKAKYKLRNQVEFLYLL